MEESKNINYKISISWFIKFNFSLNFLNLFYDYLCFHFFQTNNS